MAMTTGTGDEWALDVARNKTQQGYVLAILILGIGIAFMTILRDATPDAAMIGGINVVFAAVIAAMAYRTRLNGRRILVVNDEGVWFRDWRGPTIPWGEIASVDMEGVRLKAQVRLTLRDPERVLSMIDADKRSAFEKNPLVKLPQVIIPDNAVNAALPKVQEVLSERLRASRR